MDRRKFLVTTGASVCTLALPLQTLASVVSIPKAGTVESIDYVFQIMSEYGFNSIDERAGLFSYYPRNFKSMDDLYKSVHKLTVRWGSQDHLDRIRFLATIRQKLVERFGRDISAHLTWLNQPSSEFRGKSPREMMSTLGYFDLQHVVHVLESEECSTVVSS